MAERHKIVVVGSGPAGLSAAGRAAALGQDHVLLEKTDHLSDTIYKYQKGKLVMATPDDLDVRSDMSFKRGAREEVLGAWDDETAKLKVNVRYNAEVTAVTGEKGGFTVTLKDGETIEADYVVLGIGLQSNLRTLRVPGADLDFIQYQLDDPDMYDDETIIVIGTGDAGIENALGLAKKNDVIILNRGQDFPRAKAENREYVRKAINDNVLDCEYGAEPERIEPGRMFLKNGRELPCERVIARMGADTPRKFLESCGVKFQSADRAATPPVDAESFESKDVPGLYIIGALIGTPLIKHCMNQGYEVVQHIVGDPVPPADQSEFEKKFQGLPGFTSVPDALERIVAGTPLLAGVQPSEAREYLRDGSARGYGPGEIIFKRNDFGSSLFCVLEGSVVIEIDPSDPSKVVETGAGEFFGEIGLIAGRPRSATVRAGAQGASLVEMSRPSAFKLSRDHESSKKTLDDTVLLRQMQSILGGGLTKEDLAPIIATANLREYWPASARDMADRERRVAKLKEDGQEIPDELAYDPRVVIHEGDESDSLFIVRRGSLVASKQLGGREIVLSYIPAGNYVGEIALMRGGKRTATVKPAVLTEAIRLDGEAFRKLIDERPQLRESFEEVIRRRRLREIDRVGQQEHSSIVDFLVKQGAGEAVDMLLIDEDLCIACDNCERACAETHGGVSRLDREAGPTIETSAAIIHVPTSCRHCEHPHCMKDCPPDAIKRAPNGEVFINETCIGCGNCQANCPYGVIQMSELPKSRPSLLGWMMFGRSPWPYFGGGSSRKPAGSGDEKKAVKCDMCRGIAGGPACVRACPTGAAIRVGPQQFLNITREQG